MYLRDGSFSSDVGNVNLHQLRGTYWVAYVNENYFDSSGCTPPQKLSGFIGNQNGHRFHSEYKIQGLTSEKVADCAAYCLYIIYLTKILGIDFKSTVLNFSIK